VQNVTDYLAQPEDTQDFCNGITQLLEDEQLRKTMSENCRSLLKNILEKCQQKDI
jgi:glycosyltransferase involved in cell wall biosynthesis